MTNLSRKRKQEILTFHHRIILEKTRKYNRKQGFLVKIVNFGPKVLIQSQTKNFKHYEWLQIEATGT